jgi:hypothetical protein
MNVLEQVFGNSGEQLGQAGVLNYQRQAAEQIRSRRRMDAQVDAMNKCRGLEVESVDEEPMNILNNVITDQATLLKLLEQNKQTTNSSDEGDHCTPLPQPPPPARNRWGWMIPLIFGLLTLTTAASAYLVLRTLFERELRYEFVENNGPVVSPGEPSNGSAVRDLDVRLGR